MLVAIVLQRGPLRRGWIIAVPVVLYAVWYVSYGSPARTPSDLSAHNVATSPAYVLDGFASSIASLFGLGSASRALPGQGGARLGAPPAGGPRRARDALGAAHAHPDARAGSSSPLAVGLAFWFMTAANFGLGRPPTVSRYQYVGAVFVLLIAGELAAGWRPGWRAILAAFAVALAAALSNLATLHDGYRAWPASRRSCAAVSGDWSWPPTV